MILFFNLENLEKEANGDHHKFMMLLSNYYYKKPPKRGWHHPKLKLTGSSFILNPEPLFKIKKLEIVYIIQYIRLAARRDYFLYKQYNVKSLDLSFFPDLNYSAIKYNPLLKIENNQLLFYYEEHRK